MLLIVLFVDHMLVDIFGLDRQNFFLITGFLLLLGISLFWFFSFTIFETFFTTKKRLKLLVKKTLHELNTPVATIEINTKMLRKKIDDKALLQKLDRIDQACQNLLHLYKDMEYSIKKEVHSLENEQIQLDELIQDSIKKFDEIKGDITITNSVQTCTITTEKRGFQTVIDNLISNAIKYNHKDGYVKIYMQKTNLIVEDSGIGIDTKNLFMVFDRYYQQDSSTEGFGMGLAVVKEFCDNNKIAIKIDSHTGSGSKFILDLKHLL